MNIITPQTVPGDIKELRRYAPYLKWSPSSTDENEYHFSIKRWNEVIPVWSVDSMVYGLQRVTELAGQGAILFDAYNAEEIASEPSKANVKFWYLPAKKEADKPFIISCAGGAYQSVCSFVEAFPTAARWNELGYSVFVLNYRVALPHLMPKPLEDVAAVLRTIFSNKERFGIQNNQYVVNGYSAGANLIATWSYKPLGYGKFNVPKPLAAFLVYPPVTWNPNDPAIIKDMLITMFGPETYETDATSYDIVRNMNTDYPPCYIVHSKDDDTVLCQNSEQLHEKLDLLKIANCLELVSHGGHGFGDGFGTDAEGWPDRAVQFLENLETKKNRGVFNETF